MPLLVRQWCPGTYSTIQSCTPKRNMEIQLISVLLILEVGIWSKLGSLNRKWRETGIFIASKLWKYFKMGGIIFCECSFLITAYRDTFKQLALTRHLGLSSS